MNTMVVKKILGKNVLFRFDSCKQSEVILDEISIYPTITEESPVDFTIAIDNKYHTTGEGVFCHNPQEIKANEKVLEIDYKWGIIRWNDSNDVQVSFRPIKETGLKALIRRFRDKQFDYPSGWAGNYIHEAVIINSAFFQSDCFALHGSGISNQDGRVIIIGGTGGTGKTSTILSMRNRKDRIFVCDDLSVVTKSGKVYVNYDKPKIYAYNVKGNNTLESLVLENESWISRIQWNMKKKVNPSNVRRRISPQKLYTIADEKLSDKLTLDTYLILNRTDYVDSIKVTELDPIIASEMTIEILRDEFARFCRALNYWKLNGLYSGFDIKDSEEILSLWKRNMEELFSKISIKLVSIPYSLDNEVLKNEMNKLIDNIYKAN